MSTSSSKASGGGKAAANAKPAKKGNYITLMALVMMNVTIIAGLGNDVQQSFYGLSSVTYFLIGGIFFFIPTGLVAAELASGWSERGGIFRWVGEGIGPFAAFACILILWMQTTFNFGAGIPGSADTIYFFVPGDFNGAVQFAEADHTPLELLPFMLGWLVYYWVIVWLATKGVKVFANIAKYGVLLGTFLPLTVMTILAIVWLAQGHVPNTSLAPDALIPTWNGLSTLALAAGVLFSFAGIDVNAAHIKQLKDPNKEFPMAIFISMILCFLIFVVGTVIIAIVIPNNQINLLYTLNQTYMELGATIGAPWLYLVFIYLGLGASIASLITNFAGPSFMLGQVGRSGFLPKFLQNNNKHGMPSRLMYFQMGLMTIIGFIVFALPNVEGFSALITQAITILYLAYYILMFVAFLKLRSDQPNRPRGFRVPGGKVGAWIVAGIGIIACVFGIVLAFVPPAQLVKQVGSPVTYVVIIICLIVFVFLICLFLYRASRKHDWVDPTNQFAPFTWEIEGLEKPGKVLSNIPSEIMCANQDPMGMPIKRPYKPDEMMAEIPDAKDPIKQARAAEKAIAAHGVTAPTPLGKVAMPTANINSVKTLSYAPSELDGNILHPLAYTSIPHVIVPAATKEQIDATPVPTDPAKDAQAAKDLEAAADAKVKQLEVEAEAYKEQAAADEALVAAEQKVKEATAAAKNAQKAAESTDATAIDAASDANAQAKTQPASDEKAAAATGDATPKTDDSNNGNKAS